MRITVIILSTIFLCHSICAQVVDSPYEMSWKKDTPWIVGSLSGTALGLYIKSNKKNITNDRLNSIKSEDIIGIDGWAAGNYSEKANNVSDIPFYGSFALPFGLLLDKNANKHAVQILGLYLESLATTSAFFTITAGLVNRSRPLVYNSDAPLNERLEANGQNSFYSGHVAATATAAFFAAKVFSDFNPDSKLKPFVWTVSAVIPVLAGYYRIEARKHFLTDVVLGYILGAATGILVPEFHKRKENKVKVFPSAGRLPLGQEFNAITLRLSF
ncbi:phosphatase PAP2 family protein [Costertonia aggregata]|uniref:Phosphatase PAP2 family protein n=1 Tax=Costertonia aggregata TaxID=343403 RepID=A0A7H9ASM9_9FLAO|nr:phosphatase PAP2 family protein [Costertonia aggregata]QLG46488.1 phosphatase PAP2 family protein [Costertonia aggregata]